MIVIQSSRSACDAFTGWHPSGNLLVFCQRGKSELANNRIVCRRTSNAVTLRRTEPPALCTPVDKYVDRFRLGSRIAARP